MTITKVKLLDNGLLDLSETPAHLVETHVYRTLMDLEVFWLIASSVRRNATESPLLRLPAEIRNRIFEYALGGDTIEIDRKFECEFKCDVDHGGEDKQFFHCCWACRSYFRTVPPFALVQVCRMIYAEAAILGYVCLNTALPRILPSLTSM